jgi:hypothetical protein
MTELRILELGVVLLGTLLAGPFGAIAAGPVVRRYLGDE